MPLAFAVFYCIEHTELPLRMQHVIENKVALPL